MGLLKNPKFTTWVIGILVVLNVLTLTVLAQRTRVFDGNRSSHRGDGERDRDPITYIFSKRLEFSSEQQEQLKTLRQEHHSEMRTIDSTLEASRKQLFSLLSEEDNNPEEIQVLYSEIGSLFSQKEATTFEHFSDIRAICTPEQLPEFRRITSRLGRMFSPEGRNRRRGEGFRGRDQRSRRESNN